MVCEMSLGILPQVTCKIRRNIHRKSYRNIRREMLVWIPVSLANQEMLFLSHEISISRNEVLMELELKLEWLEGVTKNLWGVSPPVFFDTPSSHSNFNSNSITSLAPKLAKICASQQS